MTMHSIGRKLRWVTSTALLCLSACGGTAQISGAEESNTNWLKQCDADGQCGSELACLCGVCSQPCGDQSCPEALVCTPGAICGETDASCQARCDVDDDCSSIGSGAMCTNGVCVVPPGMTLTTEDVSTAPAESATLSSMDSSSPSLDAGPSEDICTALFLDACDREFYDFYEGMCINENRAAAIDVLGCVVPNCWTPSDANTATGCLEQAVDAHATPEIQALSDSLEERCGPRGETWQVLSILSHAVMIADPEWRASVVECAGVITCDSLVNCLGDPADVPWYM